MRFAGLTSHLARRMRLRCSLWARVGISSISTDKFNTVEQTEKFLQAGGKIRLEPALNPAIRKGRNVSDQYDEGYVRGHQRKR